MIKMNIDKYGLIVQSDGDGGDTAARMGQWLFVNHTETSESNLILAQAMWWHLQPSVGIWIRHPMYPDTSDCSRDQMDPIIMTLGANNLGQALRDTFKAHIKRGFFYQNKDVPMLVTPCLYIRAFKTRWLYPVLCVLDIGFCFAWIENLLRRNPDDVDDNNNIMRMLQAAQVMPTPLSWIGRKLYVLTRKPNLGNSVLGERSAVMGALKWYHRPESGGNPEIAEAYRASVERYFI
jgi:hypothetical protein